MKLLYSGKFANLKSTDYKPNHSAATVWLYMLEKGTQVFQSEKYFEKGRCRHN